jgi:small subunit ribosomal protein S5e
MVALNLPADVLATADGTRKLFNKWSYDDVEVKDISLQDYIQIRQQVYLPHTAGRFAVKRFRKAQVSINFLVWAIGKTTSKARKSNPLLNL